MIVKPFRKEDFQEISEMPKQAFMKPFLMIPGCAEELEKGFAFSGFVNGRIIACAGLMPLWEGCAKAWAFTTIDVGGHGMLLVHRAVSRMLATRFERRIEADVDANFEQGHRWIKMLGGFAYEGPLRKYTPDGRDCIRYARVI